MHVIHRNQLLLVCSLSCWLSKCSIFVTKFCFNIGLQLQTLAPIILRPWLWCCHLKFLASFFLFHFYLNFWICFHKDFYTFLAHSSPGSETIWACFHFVPCLIASRLGSSFPSPRSFLPKSLHSAAASSASYALKNKSSIPWEASYL